MFLSLARSGRLIESKNVGCKEPMSNVAVNEQGRSERSDQPRCRPRKHKQQESERSEANHPHLRFQVAHPPASPKVVSRDGEMAGWSQGSGSDRACQARCSQARASFSLRRNWDDKKYWLLGVAEWGFGARLYSEYYSSCGLTGAVLCAASQAGLSPAVR